MRYVTGGETAKLTRAIHAAPWHLQGALISPNVNLLVFDTTKSVLDAATRVNHDQFTTPGQFDHESHKVDAYWKAHLPN
jgi:hypothetical protein